MNLEECDALPIGAKVEVVWSGGNGPHVYTVTGKDKSGHCELSTERDIALGRRPMCFLDEFVGEHPLTTVRRMD